MDDLVIAKVNGIENEVDGVYIKHFPTILFYKKGSGDKSIVYSGALKKTKLKKWLKKKLGDDWKEADKGKEGL